ncbi:hypothetical protein MTO96_031989 [Rhipicephalus appendiculatus]
MKSPSLYEHLRAHKILILPSRLCLQKYIKGGNVSPGLLEALLSEDHLMPENEAPPCDDITLPVEAAEIAIDHADYVQEPQ